MIPCTPHAWHHAVLIVSLLDCVNCAAKSVTDGGAVDMRHHVILTSYRGSVEYTDTNEIAEISDVVTAVTAQQVEP